MFNRHLTVALTAIGFAAICLMPSLAYSSVISLTATDSGLVTETGGTDKFDATVVADAKGNYSVGYEVACPAGGLCPGDFIRCGQIIPTN